MEDPETAEITVAYRGETAGDTAPAVAAAVRLGLPRPTPEALMGEVLRPICRALWEYYSPTTRTLSIPIGEELSVDFDLPPGSLGPTYAKVTLVTQWTDKSTCLVMVAVRACGPVWPLRLMMRSLLNGGRRQVGILFSVRPFGTRWWVREFR